MKKKEAIKRQSSLKKPYGRKQYGNKAYFGKM